MRWLKEPLFHSFLIGVGIFLLFNLVSGPVVQHHDRIVISSNDIRQLSTLWESRWQRPPTKAELDGLIEARISEEVLYREARALGLEQDDTIVRRRMVQKMEFLFQDVFEYVLPAGEALKVSL